MATRASTRRRPRRARRHPRAAALAELTPYLGLVRPPTRPEAAPRDVRELVVATYNVHRWTGLNGRGTPDPGRACYVISELGADVIALQEVLRPFEGEDALVALADALRMHLAFVTTRVHRLGELGNAILSRWPIASATLLDLSFSRLESRAAVAAELPSAGDLSVLSTHLALVDRTRHRQVRHLLEHPQLRSGPTILLGDMNAWRDCRATRTLDRELRAHDNTAWPPTFPAARPVLALDRVYARGAKLLELRAHASTAARRASDHLPVLAHVALE